MKITFTNPPALSAPTGYAHIAVVESVRQVHISGQVALAPDGSIVGVGDLAAQTAQVYENLAAALASVGADVGHVVKFVTYVVGLDSEKAAAIRQVRNRYLADLAPPASTMVGVTSLVLPELLIRPPTIRQDHHLRRRTDRRGLRRVRSRRSPRHQTTRRRPRHRRHRRRHPRQNTARPRHHETPRRTQLVGTRTTAPLPRAIRPPRSTIGSAGPVALAVGRDPGRTSGRITSPSSRLHRPGG
jgi:enamine deaminase RidA (YjgF/YER057c/UK114 family)